MTGRFKEIYNKLIKSYRLSVYDLKNLTEKFSLHVTLLRALLVLLSICIINIILTILAIVYTPVKHSIPGFPSRHMSKMIVYNAMMIDSLEQEILMRDNYLDKIQRVISGEIIDDSVSGKKQIAYSDIAIEPMNNDSIFESLIGPDKYKFSYAKSQEEVNSISKINFFPPVKGLVTNKFNASPGHFGTDIVGQFKAPVSAVLEGTVIFAEWSVSTGYVIEIQHDYNLVSIYKHNSEIVAKPGQRVVAGEIIAFMGNEGELSTGPHLHFEMWQNGKPLDTQQYIDF